MRDCIVMGCSLQERRYQVNFVGGADPLVRGRPPGRPTHDSDSEPRPSGSGCRGTSQVLQQVAARGHLVGIGLVARQGAQHARQDFAAFLVEAGIPGSGDGAGRGRYRSEYQWFRPKHYS